MDDWQRQVRLGQWQCKEISKYATIYYEKSRENTGLLEVCLY